MLKGKGVPNLYWAEAVHTAVYILNRSPTKAVRNKTPFEAWYKKKPVVDHFRIFGCTAYALIPSQKREKFDGKGQKLVFVGYSDESKGYHLLDPSTSKVIISRDMIFDENSAWDFKEKQIVESDYYHDPLTSQASPSQVQNDESQRIEDDSYEESPPRKTRPLSEIYESTEQVLFASEPQSFEDASKDERWTKAMNEEMSTIEKNKTWELVDLPNGKKTIGLKWIFKIKFNQYGSIQKYKARLVAKGYSEQPGIDFTETYAPVARIETIRIVLAVAAQLELQVYQLDVKSAFLNGEIEEEVYVEQPEGFIVKGKEEKVCRLKKALYGLKQAPRAWNSKINSYFIENGFNRSLSESSLYV
ncbi:UNVERIFIED_CONTAM: Retrovirus-related Pol polyprotein from transposon TNT 1-94 [Sesamum radiatum]|uniref:Retrovirus-related Pol polyprotein from transposon TNT 1-94 n=1 Tax=Sesamum radiatum TaxID=300843 RepID=A0AAW2K8A4_SESRA